VTRKANFAKSIIGVFVLALLFIGTGMKSVPLKKGITSTRSSAVSYRLSTRVSGEIISGEIK
jgi:hypothetical protein